MPLITDKKSADKRHGDGNSPHDQVKLSHCVITEECIHHYTAARIFPLSYRRNGQVAQIRKLDEQTAPARAGVLDREQVGLAGGRFLFIKTQPVSLIILNNIRGINGILINQLPAR